MDIVIQKALSLPCTPEVFRINSVDSEVEWFAIYYYEPSCYGCSEAYPEPINNIEEVRSNLPDDLKNLTDAEIREIQHQLMKALRCTGCYQCE